MTNGLNTNVRILQSKLSRADGRNLRGHNHSAVLSISEINALEEYP
jgi:hypothetical protein